MDLIDRAKAPARDVTGSVGMDLPAGSPVPPEKRTNGRKRSAIQVR
jgi:hypothetical protein